MDASLSIRDHSTVLTIFSDLNHDETSDRHLIVDFSFIKTLSNICQGFGSQCLQTGIYRIDGGIWVQVHLVQEWNINGDKVGPSGR